MTGQTLPLISIIIPTYNREAILDRCLQALLNQTLNSDQYEVIIIDDGSTDGTSNLIKQYIKDGRRLIYHPQTNRGQGNARNTGIRLAKGEIIVFIGDDIIVENNFLEEHLKVHTAFPAENHAVLGHIDWHPDLKLTPFMKWLTNGSAILGKFGGHQFAYEKLKNRQFADYNFFYTSNLSLKKSLLTNNLFDPEFSKYGWEDIELGYRLTKNHQLILHYNSLAKAYHYHQLDEMSLAPRLKQIGSSAYIIDKKYPELHKIPTLQKKTIFHLISNPLSLGIFKVVSIIIPIQKTKDYYYYALSKKYFLQGIKINSQNQSKKV